MGLGSTAKKLQTMVDHVETLLARMKDIKEQVEGTQATVDETAARVERIEAELADQRVVLDRIADAQGVDVDDVGDSDVDDVGDGDSDPGGDNAS
jgi:uncharacterized protein YoxC